jgi:hypothetical protein
LVFGGPDFSKKRAIEFDPTRPKEELDKILTFNGLFPEVFEKRAPRGCIGVHLVMSLSEKLIDAILPHPVLSNFSQVKDTSQEVLNSFIFIHILFHYSYLLIINKYIYSKFLIIPSLS